MQRNKPVYVVGLALRPQHSREAPIYHTLTSATPPVDLNPNGPEILKPRQPRTLNLAP